MLRPAQVETQLKGRDVKKGRASAAQRPPALPVEDSIQDVSWEPNEPLATIGNVKGIQNMPSMTDSSFDALPPATSDTFNLPMSSMAPNITSDYLPSMNLDLDDSFSWEMIGLGLEEPMPTQEAIDEL